MRNSMRILLAAALVSFGAIAGVVRPAYAEDEIIPCGGRSEPVCGSSKSEVCTRFTVCGVIWPKGISVCCSEKQTTVEYSYYD